jgi:hypothetical protein
MTARSFPGKVTLAVAAGSLAALGVTACHSGAASSAAAPAAPSSGGGSSPAAGQATAVAAGTTAAAIHACSLLSAAQASAAVGVTYTSATEASAGQQCSYATTTAPIPMFIIVSPGAGTAAWTGELATLREDAGSAPITLSGAGDRAAGCGTEIAVQSGGYIIDVHGGDPLGTGHAFPKSIAVAKVIIAALPGA